MGEWMKGRLIIMHQLPEINLGLMGQEGWQKELRRRRKGRGKGRMSGERSRQTFWSGL